MIIKTFILNLIGTLTALGQPVDIPIILRTLAGSIALCDEESLPLTPSPEYLAALDAGEFDKVVLDFELNWWSGRKPRDLNAVTILNASTVEICLDHYMTQRDSQPGSRIISNPGPGTGLTREAILFHDAGKTGKSQHSAGARAGSSRTAPAPISAGCQSCPQYRQLLSDVLRDILKYQNYASVMATSSKNLFHLGVRKASTFNLLYEAAVLKETAGIPPPAKASNIKHISNVRSHASSELNRLKDMPASSYKWTWGESLTEKEVISLRRPGTKPGRIAHSGYDISVPDGRMEGEYSAGPSGKFSSNGNNENLPAEAHFIPPSTDLQLPEFFSKRDIRIYDPLKLSSNDTSLVGHNPTPAPGPEVHDLAENWDSDSCEAEPAQEAKDDQPSAAMVFNALQLAESWNSGSEGEPVPLPALTIANNWGISNSGSDPEKNPAPAPATLADNWDSSSEQNEVEPAQETRGEDQPAPAAVLNPLQLAESWISGSEGDTVPLPLGSTVFNLADNWDSGSGDDEPDPVPGPHDSGSIDNGEPVPGPVTTVLNLADTWDSSDYGSHDHDEPIILPEIPILNLAENWTDREDEVVPPGQSQASVLADAWEDSEESGDGKNHTLDEEPDRREGDWAYGPQHFSSLKDYMFEVSSDEDY